MAKFDITGPDGKKYRVEGENAEGALSALRKMLGDTGQPVAAPEQTPMSEGMGRLSAMSRDPQMVPDDLNAKLGIAGRRADPVGEPVARPEIDRMSLPLNARDDDMQVGYGIEDPKEGLIYDMAIGENTPGAVPVYRTSDGKTFYSKGTVFPNSGERKPWSEVDLGDVARVGKNVARGIYEGVKEGVMAPGRAAAGEPVTLGETMNTAGLVATGIGNVVPKTLKPIAANAPAKAAMAERGIQPSLGMRGKPAAMVAGALEKFIPSAHIIANDAARAVAQVQRAFSETVAGLGRASSPDAAGAGMQASLRKFVDTFQENASKLYDKADELILQDKPFSIPQFQKALAESKAAFAKNPAMAKKIGLTEWDAIAEEAAKSGAPWDAIKQLRTEIGEAIGGKPSGPLADQSTGKLKGLYKALTDDMTEAAEASGPEALKAWRRANSYYRAGTDRVENALDDLIGKNAKEGPQAERAFEAFTNMSKADRSTADVKRMQRIKSSMDPQAWGDLSASIVDRLGKAKAGAQSAAGDVFSPSTFLTEWNKLSETAKRILVKESVRVELQKLATIAEKVKAGNAERNISNTGTVGGGAAFGALMMASPVKGAALAGGMYIGAKAMTSPGFLRLLNASKGKAIPIATIQAYLDKIQGSDQPKP